MQFHLGALAYDIDHERIASVTVLANFRHELFARFRSQGMLL
jgi:hypothetical protein